MTLAIFDFDGTITYKDSLADFIRYAVGTGRYISGLILMSPVLAGYRLRLIDNNIAKEKLLSHFFRGWPESRFRETATRYSLQRIDRIVRPGAIEQINWHRNHGHEIYVISASMRCWLEPWCKKNNLKLIATELEFKDNKFTGRFAGKNCHGPEKLHRIKKAAALEKYDEIYVYGDSPGDKHLFTIGTKNFYKPFRK